MIFKEHLKAIGFGQYNKENTRVNWFDWKSFKEFNYGVITFSYKVKYDEIPDNNFWYGLLYETIYNVCPNQFALPRQTSFRKITADLYYESDYGDYEECIKKAKELIPEHIEFNKERMMVKKKLYKLAKYCMKQIGLNKSVKWTIDFLYFKHGNPDSAKEELIKMGINLPKGKE